MSWSGTQPPFSPRFLLMSQVPRVIFFLSRKNWNFDKIIVSSFIAYFATTGLSFLMAESSFLATIELFTFSKNFWSNFNGEVLRRPCSPFSLCSSHDLN